MKNKKILRVSCKKIDSMIFVFSTVSVMLQQIPFAKISIKRCYFCKRLLIVFLVLCFLGCKKYKIEGIVTVNTLYTDMFSEENKISESVKNKFRNKFTKNSVFSFKSFETFENEVKKYLDSKKEGVIYVPPLLSPVFIQNSIKKDMKKYKLITYGLNSINKSNVKVFNITFNEEIFYDKIIDYISTDLSDTLSTTLVLTNSSYYYSQQFIKYSEERRYKSFKTYNNDALKEEQLKKHLQDNKYSNIILFSYENNAVINKMDKKDLTGDINVIEIISKYGIADKNVDSRFYIDYAALVKEGLSSKQFDDFISDAVSDKKTAVDYISQKKSTIKLEIIKKKIIIK